MYFDGGYAMVKKLKYSASSLARYKTTDLHDGTYHHPAWLG
jgi:hypothetical protein